MLSKPRTLGLHLTCDNKNSTNHPVTSAVFDPSVKPFISLDVVHASEPTNADEFLMSPDSGTAIITFLLSGEADFSDSTQKQGSLQKNDVLWILSGSGVRYALKPKTQDCISVKLRVALSPALESAPAQSIYLESNLVERDGPAQVLLGRYKNAQSGFALPALINYLVVRLSAGQEWAYEPPINHRLAWIAVITGKINTSNTLVSAAEIAVYENSNNAITFFAEQDSIFLLGSSHEYPQDLPAQEYALPILNEAPNKNNSKISTSYAFS